MFQLNNSTLLFFCKFTDLSTLQIVTWSHQQWSKIPWNSRRLHGFPCLSQTTRFKYQFCSWSHIYPGLHWTWHYHVIAFLCRLTYFSVNDVSLLWNRYGKSRAQAYWKSRRMDVLTCWISELMKMNGVALWTSQHDDVDDDSKSSGSFIAGSFHGRNTCFCSQHKMSHNVAQWDSQEVFLEAKINGVIAVVVAIVVKPHGKYVCGYEWLLSLAGMRAICGTLACYSIHDLITESQETPNEKVAKMKWWQPTDSVYLRAGRGCMIFFVSHSSSCLFFS